MREGPARRNSSPDCTASRPLHTPVGPLRDRSATRSHPTCDQHRVPSTSRHSSYDDASLMERGYAARAHFRVGAAVTQCAELAEAPRVHAAVVWWESSVQNRVRNNAQHAPVTARLWWLPHAIWRTVAVRKRLAERWSFPL